MMNLISQIPVYSKQLFLFFLIISGNYIAELFSCNIQKQFNTSRTSKHILGLLTMYFFVTFVETSDRLVNPIYEIMVAFALYGWFILISLTANKYTLLIILLLLSIYVINNISTYYVETEENEDNKKTITTYVKNTQYVIFFSAVILTLYGFLIYLSQKKIEYGSKFNYSTFFMGTKECKFDGMGNIKGIKNGKGSDFYYLKKLFN